MRFSKRKNDFSVEIFSWRTSVHSYENKETGMEAAAEIPYMAETWKTTGVCSKLHN